MNTMMNSRGPMVAALAVSLMASACKQTNDQERLAAEAERTAERTQQEAHNARREAQSAQQEAHNAQQEAQSAQVEARRTADQAAQAARQAERQAEAARQAENPTGQSPSASDRLGLTDALTNIASARCDHEQRCNNIGTGRRYQNVQACRTVVRNTFAEDLNPRDCASVDHHELSECMEEIRGEACNNPLDTLQRLAACRTSDMCRETSLTMR